MTKISYLLGMLAAGGTIGGAASASVIAGGYTTVTINSPITSDASTNTITLAGASTPQYAYGSFANIPNIDSDAASDSGLISNLENLITPGAIRSARGAALRAADSTKQDFGLVIGESFGSQPLTFQQFDANPAAYKQTGFPVAGVVNGPDADSPGGNEYFYLLFSDAPESALTPKDLFFGWATVGTPGASSTPSFIHPDGTDPSTLSTITYGAIPEPETWAMLVAGVGLVGGATRQSRRRRATLAA